MTTKTATNARTTVKAEAKPKGGSARTALPLTWQATEYVPLKRWWWFVGLTVVSLWLLGSALAFQVWSLAALIIATALVFFVMYLAKPRIWSYELTGAELRMSSGQRKLVLRLDQFKAFTVEELPADKGKHPDILIVVLPTARFRPSVDVYLTQDEGRDLEIAEVLARVLPYEDTLKHRTIGQALDRIARRLRLG